MNQEKKISIGFLIFVVCLTFLVWFIFKNIGATIIVCAVGLIIVALSAQTDSEKEKLNKEIEDKQRELENNKKDKERRKEQYDKGKKVFCDELKNVPGYDWQAEDFFGTKKEIDYLYQMVRHDEKILSMASGFLNGKTILFVCTNKRCIFIDCGVMYKVAHSEIMIDKINSVSSKTELMFAQVIIEDGASVRVISNIKKKYVQAIVDSIHEAIEMRNTKIDINGNHTVSGADELIKFKKLMDDGVITQEEFEKRKKKILEM